jgi:hypothetical protein
MKGLKESPKNQLEFLLDIKPSIPLIIPQSNHQNPKKPTKFPLGQSDTSSLSPSLSKSKQVVASRPSKLFVKINFSVANKGVKR